ncbi:MAG: alpha/beta fold hydrolase [Thermoguttaceae bacterium]
MSAKNKEIWRSQYPFESRFLDLNGLRMHYVDEQKARVQGEPARKVLLMVHGNPTWSFYYRNLISAFRFRFRTVAPDHIGCGLSDKPSEKEYSFRLERRVDDLCQLVEKLDLKEVTLIAHDWGGAIGMGAATRLPDRFERIVLLNTAAFRFDRCPFRIRLGHLPLVGRYAIQGMNLFCLSALKMATEYPRQLRREVKAGLLAPYNSWHNRTAVYRFVDDIPLSEKHPSYRTLTEIEEKLPIFRNKPVCLIWGMKDWCFHPEFLKRFLQFYPEADVHRIENAGHYVLEDAESAVISALEGFLREK